MTRNKQDPVEQLLETGSDISGGVAGAAIGMWAGPPGVILGAAAGPLIKRTFRWVSGELVERLLGPRANARMGATLAFAVERLSELKVEGVETRNDGFFAEEPAGSAGAELIEGVLLAAQQEHEEKKARLYGNLLASIATDPEIDRGLANLLLRRGEQLSYRQLCLLSIVGSQPDLYSLREEGTERGDTWRQVAILNELDELGYGRLEMVGVERQNGRLLANLGRPADLRLREMGIAIYETMNLKDVPRGDISEILSLIGQA